MEISRFRSLRTTLAKPIVAIPTDLLLDVPSSFTLNPTQLRADFGEQVNPGAPP